jgi:Transposase, Mutator family
VGTRVSPSTVSNLNKKIYGTIEAWRNRPIEGAHPYVYLDGIVLKRSWAGEVRAHDPNPLPKPKQDHIVRAEKLMSSDPN